MQGKLLLTGGSGMVGRNFRAHDRATNWEILAPSSRTLDLTDAGAVRDYIAETKPDLVIHLAGRGAAAHQPGLDLHVSARGREPAARGDDPQRAFGADQ